MAAPFHATQKAAAAAASGEATTACPSCGYGAPEADGALEAAPSAAAAESDGNASEPEEVSARRERAALCLLTLPAPSGAGRAGCRPGSQCADVLGDQLGTQRSRGRKLAGQAAWRGWQGGEMIASGDKCTVLQQTSVSAGAQGGRDARMATRVRGSRRRAFRRGLCAALALLLGGGLVRQHQAAGGRCHG